LYFILLGGDIHIRIDVLLSIVVPDMLTMIQEFSNSLLSSTSTLVGGNNITNNSTVIKENQLKPIEERWRKSSNKRNSGRYTQPPDESTMTELMSCLIAPTNDLNADFKLPTITPNWINLAIGLLLSTQTYGTYFNRPPMLSSNVSVILVLIRDFLDEWSTSRIQTNQMSNMNFKIPPNEVPEDINEQSTYILEKILISLLDCNIIANKVYVCESCKSKIKMRIIFTQIPIHINKNGLYIEHELVTFFSPTITDVICSACGKPTIRHIEMLQWPRVLIISINGSKPSFRYKKSPGVIFMTQFSHRIAIGTPSSTLYDLITFNSILRVNDKDTAVRVTKVKRHWNSSAHQRIIGNGEELRRLYGSSRKCICTLELASRLGIILCLARLN
jgi:hypothetical protein